MSIFDRVKNGVTRRGFVLGGAAASAATLLAGCSKKTGTSDDAAGEPQVIKDDSKIVSITEEYEAVDIDLKPTASWTLPLGTLLYYCDGGCAAAMMAPASALHANTLGVFNMGDGSLTTLIDDPVEGSGYAFYDVRATDSVFAWVEMNYANSSWKLYAQTLSGAALTGNAVELDRGGEDYDPPLFTAFDSSVIWYKMPSTGGNKTDSDSYCYRRSLDESKAEAIWKSTGRFASAPRVSDGILTISPRVRNDEGVYYGMTAIDLTDGNNTKRAQLVLPSSVSPFEAVYMGDTFVFSIEATYADVGGLGNMGTYIGNEGGPYQFLSREPLACAAGRKGKYLVKVQASHFLIDTSAKTYGSLLSPDRALEYGDYPATAGKSNTFLTYATVRNSQGIPETVTARLFSL
ncbi:hypothetical protein [Collinsella sp. HCP28S3_H5]|uniref:hypothetical protein n=1 Tax=unclassified Collinsella TaxID=2637548 RepID=UPI003F88C29D